MDKKEMFGKVGEILKELNEQYQYLSKAPDKMNELEIELFVANANFLADHIKIVQKLNGTPVAPAEKTEVKAAQKEESKPAEIASASPEEEPAVPIENKSEEEESDKEEVKEAPDEDLNSQQKDERELNSDFEEETQEVDNKVDDRPNDVKAAPAQEPTVATETVVQEIVIREKTISLDTPAKTSSEPAPTLNDVIAAQLDQTTVASKYNKQSVADLKSIISLNDKLLFVKDLFNGYSLAYSEAIELLNRFDSLDSADNFLKTNYSAKNNWSDKQATVDKFYEILNRRFTK